MMKHPNLKSALAVVWVLAVAISPVAATQKQSLVVVGGPTIVAFFPPVTDAELRKDPDTNESLADFQFYARQVRELCKKRGIRFHELYTRSFRVRIAGALTTFRTTKAEAGYYFIVPGKEPRVEYGVMTAADLVQISDQYFDRPAE